MAVLSNRGDLREYFKLLLSQSGSFKDSEIDDMLNVAYKKFIANSECLEDIISVSSMASCSQYALPGSIIKIKDCYYRGKLLKNYNERAIYRDKLSGQAQSLTVGQGSNVDSFYLKKYGDACYLGLYGIPGDDANTTTLASNIVLADAQMVLSDSGGFEYIGSFLLKSVEVVHYTFLDGITAKGCLRSQEGTTGAVNNSIGDAIVERDIIMYSVPNPADMDDDADVPLVDESYRETIVTGALERAYFSLKLWDSFKEAKAQFKDECFDIKGKFKFKEPGKIERMRPFYKKYA